MPLIRSSHPPKNKQKCFVHFFFMRNLALYVPKSNFKPLFLHSAAAVNFLLETVILLYYCLLACSFATAVFNGPRFSQFPFVLF